MKYKLLTTDMDDTLLDRRKQLSAGNRAAIRGALQDGKLVAFATGRCMAELEDLLEQIPEMRYLICESGAAVIDRKENRSLCSHFLPTDVVKRMTAYAEEQEIMVQLLSGQRAYIREGQTDHMETWRMLRYAAHFQKVCIPVSTLKTVLEQRNWEAEKLNLYHHSAEEREKSIAMLRGAPVTLALAEETGLEISPQGVDKGTGLEELCRALGISLTETVSVGDGFNDLPIFRKAGLAVAVANADPAVQAECGAVVADCDHDAVKEAIERFL